MLNCYGVYTQVTDWPVEDYGAFYEGDSYIILRTYKQDPNSEVWNIIHIKLRKTCDNQTAVMIQISKTYFDGLTWVCDRSVSVLIITNKNKQYCIYRKSPIHPQEGRGLILGSKRGGLIGGGGG